MHGMVKEVVELKHAGKVVPAEQGFLMVCQSADAVVGLLTELETQILPKPRAALWPPDARHDSSMLAHGSTCSPV